MVAPAYNPQVSIIIATYNRPERLAATLAAIAAQTQPADTFEVIVVDDGAAEATRQVVQYAPLPRAHYWPQSRQGATLARNYGAQRARGDLLVFLDDDIELGPDTLRHLVVAHADHPRTVVVGTLLNPGQPPRAETGTVVAPFFQCYTGLLSIPAADFGALGQFRDVTGGWPNWDDLEFGYRVEQAGYGLLRSLDAWAIHHDASAVSLAATARRYMAAAHAAARLFRVHPGMREGLPMFADKGPVDWRNDRPALVARKLLRHVSSAWPILRLLEWLERRRPSSTLQHWIVGGYIWQGYRRGLREL